MRQCEDCKWVDGCGATLYEPAESWCICNMDEFELDDEDEDFIKDFGENYSCPKFASRW